MELGCDGSPSAASFTYDVFGQQATATYNGETTTYTYNAQGIRVAKTTAGNGRTFCWTAAMWPPSRQTARSQPISAV